VILHQLRLKNFQTQLKAFKADVATVASNKSSAKLPSINPRYQAPA
jgi:hypothetical protein